MCRLFISEDRQGGKRQGAGGRGERRGRGAGGRGQGEISRGKENLKYILPISPSPHLPISPPPHLPTSHLLLPPAPCPLPPCLFSPPCTLPPAPLPLLSPHAPCPLPPCHFSPPCTLPPAPLPLLPLTSYPPSPKLVVCIMLAQFQSLYPHGSLISELVQIFQGKYIVRASILIEGVTRATGMAAAETVEAAEDQARNRALIVLGITNTPKEAVAFSSKTIAQVQIDSDLNTSTGLPNSEDVTTKEAELVDQSRETLPLYTGVMPTLQWSADDHQEISVPSSKEKDIKPDLVVNNTINTTKIDPHNSDIDEQYSFDNHWEDQLQPPMEIEPDHSSPANGITASNVTPFIPRNYAYQEESGIQSGIGKRKKKSEPVNLSDVIAKTDVQIERLGWTKEQGREYLKKTYNKLGRYLLSEEELLDFLRYLESQPDPIAGF